MAKSGQIQLNDGAVPGDSAISDKVVFTESQPTNLGGAVSDLLEASSDPVKVVVDFAARKVYVYPVATDVSTLLTGDNKKLVGTITRDDATKRSSPVTMADGDSLTGKLDQIDLKTEINGGFAESKPSKNVASIVNAVEDAMAAVAKAGVHPLTNGTAVVVDQTGDGSVKVYSGLDSISPGDVVDLEPTAMVKIVAAADTTVTPSAFE